MSRRHTHVPSLLSLPLPPPSPSHPSMLSWSPRLSTLSHTANSLLLSILHVSVYISMWLSPFISPSPSYPPPWCVHKSLFSKSPSPIAALQIDSSVWSFQVPYTCINICFVFASGFLYSSLFSKVHPCHCMGFQLFLFLREIWLMRVRNCLCSSSHLLICWLHWTWIKTKILGTFSDTVGTWQSACHTESDW